MSELDKTAVGEAVAAAVILQLQRLTRDDPGQLSSLPRSSRTCILFRILQLLSQAFPSIPYAYLMFSINLFSLREKGIPANLSLAKRTRCLLARVDMFRSQLRNYPNTGSVIPRSRQCHSCAQLSCSRSDANCSSA